MAVAVAVVVIVIGVGAEFEVAVLLKLLHWKVNLMLAGNLQKLFLCASSFSSLGFLAD